MTAEIRTAQDGRSVRDAAEALGVSRQTIYKWIVDGRLPATRIGTILRIRDEDIDAQRRPAA